MRRRTLACALLPLLLAGCGGSGHHSSSSSSSSTDTIGPQIALAWPARARAFSALAIATAAQITFPGAGANGADLTQVVSRPTGAAAITQTVQLGIAVHPGRHLMRVDFLADAASTGVPLATASVNVTITDRGAIKNLDGKDLGTVAYDSNVVGLTLAPGEVEVGQTADLVVTARAPGGVVALTPGSVKLSISSAGSNLRLNADGSVTGLAVGNAMVFAILGNLNSPAVNVAVTVPSLKARSVSLTTSDMVPDAAHGKLWVALSGGVASVDPATGTVGATISVGAAPDILALSDDGAALYADLPSIGAVRRVDTASSTVVGSFGLPGSGFGGVGYAVDLAVQPGTPSTLAIIRRDAEDSGYDGPAIYDNGVRRPNALNTYDALHSLWIASDRLIAYAGYNGINDVAVDSQGATTTRTVSTTADLSHRLVLAGGRLYAANGVVIDATTLEPLGAFTLTPYQGGTPTFVGPAVDVARKRVYFVELGASGNYARLHVYDADSFAEIGETGISGLTFAPLYGSSLEGSLSLFGADTLAFRLPNPSRPPRRRLEGLGGNRRAGRAA